MRLSLTSGQITCIFYIAMFVSSFTLGAFAYDAKVSTCCHTLTSAEVKDPIQSCARVPGRRRGRGYCYEAYVLSTEGTTSCININAPWIEETLAKLKQDGNPCKGTPQ
ncbi:hypothetical protein AMEX_G2237 [Astyanax mexicanus]|uniref:Chemokine interleukin-8-like domain-containing protein n=1 Tax=Astyanax mexicanus TaxID=7994 RepID=A0A8T2MGA8_ASTMX|nr:hypothetical protein AMEX_G2237 [Astyanax mexicanus]